MKSSIKINLLILNLLLLSSALVYCFYNSKFNLLLILSNSEIFVDSKIADNWPSCNSSGEEKLIVFHSKLYTNEKWMDPNYTKDGIFYRLCHGSYNCPYKCAFTHKRELSNIADAVQFSVLDALYHADIPFIPKPRNLSQLWIGVTYEASAHHDGASVGNPIDSIFNWTSSYRKDSEYYVPYGYIEKIDRNSINSIDPTLPIISNFTGKKLVAGLMSHCDTQSKRENLIRAMQKYVPVHVYGKCGFTCPNGTDCRLFLAGKYKFYLAFENSLCEDYVTEKFFLALKNHMISVVYGLADYKKLAPPHSYINVVDFSSVPTLTKHLLHVSRNHTEYMKYFEWKRDFQISQDPLRSICDFCKSLWNVKENYHKEYPSFNKW